MKSREKMFLRMDARVGYTPFEARGPRSGHGLFPHTSTPLWGRCMKTIDLHTSTLDLAFDSETGALVGLVAPSLGWTIHRRPELGLSWQLLVPVSESLRNNPVHGQKQRLSSCEADERHVRFVWDGVESERAGRLDIRVEVEVRAEGPQAVWRTRVANNTDFVVESVYSPCIGDLSRPADEEPFGALHYCYNSGIVSPLWPCFRGNGGDYGVEVPTLTLGGVTPQSPFIILRTRRQGLYVGVRDSSGESVAWNTELLPGYDSAIDSRVPGGDEIAGKPVHTRFSVVHQRYLQPGSAEEMTPIALEAYEGDWQKGVDIYCAWRDTWSSQAVPPAWAREPHSWLQLHVNSPEDELRMRFAELPKVAAECARLGVKAIQLVGWNDGGQDQGNPSHSPDPRLGSYEELKRAVEECERLGVKVIIFSKFTWADRGEPWYRNELHRYAVTDPYGAPYYHPGYMYFTPAQLLDINTKRFAPMCFGCEEYLEIARREFAKVAGLGAPGFLFDECLHHGIAKHCFNMDHGHKYGWPCYSNDRELVRRFMRLPGLRDDFLFAGEACYDWQFEVYALSYFRSRDKWHIPLQRYMRPHAQIMTAVSGFNDRSMVNQCLMYRYIMSYEPYNFKGWLHDFPDTVAYGQRMDAMRRELRAWLWDGEFRDTCGATVTDAATGAAHHPFSRFEAADGTSMLVVCNYDDEHDTTVVAALDSGATLTRFRAVEDADWTAIPPDGRLVIPPRSAIVVG